MNINHWLSVCICSLLIGCATYKGVGSETWYQNRIQEIETAASKNEITRAEAIRLKNEADAIRADYIQGRSPRTGVGFHYGIFH
jgi:hypothetical protein